MSARDSQQKFAAAADALFEGDSETAAALMAEGAAAAGAVDLDAVAQHVERRASVMRAAREMMAANPGIAGDPDMIFLADRAIDLKMRGGMAPEAAIMEAGSEISERYKLNAKREEETGRRGDDLDGSEETPQSIIAELRAARVSGQGEATGDAAGGGQGFPEEDPSAVIAELRRGRIGTPSS